MLFSQGGEGEKTADNEDERTFEMLCQVKTGGQSSDPFLQLQQDKSGATGKRARILVVDDFANLRTLMVQTLQQMGMEEQIDQILRQMAELVLKGREVKNVDFKKEEQGPAALRSLLQVAGQCERGAGVRQAN